ncbi:IucA/IucC family protein [Photobacterium sanctipauli]|nr:IucA/IucC family protein [Photobacterium sanctipauli]
MDISSIMFRETITDSCAEQMAGEASLQAFLNGYLREVDNGQWYEQGALGQAIPLLGDSTNKVNEDAKNWWVKLPITHLDGFMVIEVTYRTVVGRHSFAQAVLFIQDKEAEVLLPADAISVLVREMYSKLGKGEGSAADGRELKGRISDSLQLMARYLSYQLTNPCSTTTFIDNEQALVFGHWQHPTPKSRQGMLDYHHASYAPEMKGQFRLHYFQVHHSIIRQRSAVAQSADCILADCLGITPFEREGYIVLPMHPLQAQWLLHQPFMIDLIAEGKVVDCGYWGAKFSATSSVRSLYNPELDWMLKFSLPVKITNSLRVNKRHELEAGVVMTRLFRKTGFSDQYPQFQVVADPAYITVDLPDRTESGFEIIIRENPFKQGHDEATYSLAALTQDPLPGESSQLLQQIQKLAQATGSTLFLAAMKWLAGYWECAIAPMIRLYDEHGIALEAHQQNSVLVLDHQGQPETYYFRDNQGYYLSNSYQAYQASLDPDLAIVPDLYFDDELICDRFSYYLLINNLFAVIGRMGADGLADENTLLAFIQQRLAGMEQSLVGAGRRYVQRLLSESELPMKGNLLTRVYDIDELEADNEQAVYTKISNPLMALGQPHCWELTAHAIA